MVNSYTNKSSSIFTISIKYLIKSGCDPFWLFSCSIKSTLNSVDLSSRILRKIFLQLKILPEVLLLNSLVFN